MRRFELKNKRFMIWSFILAFVMFSRLEAVQEEQQRVATLERFDGVVKVLPKGSVRRTKAKVNLALYSGDMVLSYRNAHALITLVDGSKVLLDERASISFAYKEVGQQEGAALYEIHHRNAKNAFRVKTEFAIIGIKGTTFIVNANAHDKSVALKEGRIEVKSPEAEYKLYREKELAKFEAYKSQQKAGFETYKKRQEEKVLSYVKAFEMESEKIIRFEGSTVDESRFDANVSAEFERFKRIETSLH